MRKNLFKWHSISALIALIPLMVISITGSILVFKVEIDTFLMPDQMVVNVKQSQPRLNFDQLIEKVETAYPEYLMGSWEIFDDKMRADTAYIFKKGTAQWSKLYLNQYSGELLSEPVSLTNDFTDWLLSLHYTFLLDFTGTLLGCVFAIILLFLGISGIILHKQFWRKLFTLRLHSARRIFYSDVHKLIGIISSPIIIILAFTGGYYNISVAVHEIGEHIEAHPLLEEPLYSKDINFDALLKSSETDLEGFKATFMTFPFEPELHVTFYGEVPTANPLTSEYASTITYDRLSGVKTHSFDVRKDSTLLAFVDTFRKLHFGYFAGLASKIIWCVIGLSPLWLSLTGLYFYWFRKRKSISKYRANALIKSA